MTSLRSGETGPDVLAIMQPGVQAREDFISRWEKFEAANMPSLIDQSQSHHSEGLAIAGLPIEDVYTGLEVLRDEEVLTLQARVAQEELAPKVEEYMGDLTLDIVAAVKGQLLETRDRRWAQIYGHSLDGLAVEVRPLTDQDIVRYSTQGPGTRRSRSGYLYSGYFAGLITGLSIADRGSITLEEGYKWFSGAKPSFDLAEISRIFAKVSDGSRGFYLAPAVEVTPITGRGPDDNPAMPVALAVARAA